MCNCTAVHCTESERSTASLRLVPPAVGAYVSAPPERPGQRWETKPQRRSDRRQAGPARGMPLVVHLPRVRSGGLGASNRYVRVNVHVHVHVRKRKGEQKEPVAEGDWQSRCRDERLTLSVVVYTRPLRHRATRDGAESQRTTRAQARSQ